MKKASFIAIIGMLFSSLSFAEGLRGEHSQKRQSQQEQTVAEKATINDINEDTQSFIGRRVQIDGEVEDVVVEGQSFIIEGDTWTDNEILVVSKGRIMNLESMEDEDRRVSLTGTVKHANFYEIENDLESGINPEMEIDKKKGVTYILLDDFRSAGRLSE